MLGCELDWDSLGKGSMNGFREHGSSFPADLLFNEKFCLLLKVQFVVLLSATNFAILNISEITTPYFTSTKKNLSFFRKRRTYRQIFNRKFNPTPFNSVAAETFCQTGNTASSTGIINDIRSKAKCKHRINLCDIQARRRLIEVCTGLNFRISQDLAQGAFSPSPKFVFKCVTPYPA
jgi:hypothetical protein